MKLGKKGLGIMAFGLVAGLATGAMAEDRVYVENDVTALKYISGTYGDGGDHFQVGEGVFGVFDPGVLLEGTTGFEQLQFQDLTKYTWRTRTGATPANVDISLQWYTNHPSNTNGSPAETRAVYGASDAGWYQRNPQAEPLYFTNGSGGNYDNTYPDNTWNTFSTDPADTNDPANYWDTPHSVGGDHTGQPTHADLMSTSTTARWSDFGTATGTTPVGYGNMGIRFGVIKTSAGGNWAGFDGDMDQIYMEHSNGDTATLHLRPDILDGDANLDGNVNGLDLSILAANWLRTDDSHWGAADFDGDFITNGLDLSILAANWNASGGGTASGSGVSFDEALAAVGLGGIPEPASVMLLAAGSLLLTRRQRRG